MTDKLSIIIPAFAGIQQTRLCLQALKASTYQDFRVLLVDHGVKDELSRMIVQEFPWVTCLRGSADLWWSGASNVGIRYAVDNGSQWLMLLNHDCYVEKTTLATLMTQIENNSDSVIAPMQHALRKRRDIIGMTSCFLLGFPTIIPPATYYRLRYSAGLVPTDLIGGGRGVVFSTAVIKRVGLLDEEHLPHYYADHDFYFRCRKAGLSLFISTDTRVNIDDRMTSSATPREVQSLAGIRNAMSDRSSHRNIRDLRILFSRYYPIPGLSVIGVALNSMRFFFMILTSKLVEILMGNNRNR